MYLIIGKYTKVTSRYDIQYLGVLLYLIKYLAGVCNNHNLEVTVIIHSCQILTHSSEVLEL